MAGAIQDNDTSANAAARQMLEQLMQQRGWRVPQAADALGVSSDIVRRWLVGRTRIQIEDMVAIARLQQADLNEVFGLQVSGVSFESQELDRLVELKARQALIRLLLRLLLA